VAGKYRVDRIVGYGGMGFVVEAWHLSFEERVAIKLLRKEVIANEEALVRFEREARAAFKIKSEHVARVIDVGRLDNGAPYMVMEYLEGTDLGAVLADRRTLPIPEAVDYILQTCEAIAEAHSLGIIHRDLKPENLFLSERRDGALCIKVLDFGLSKVMPKAEMAQRERALTATKQVMGTAEYMSPEQWLSARDVEPPTDIWSLGVILFELLAGHTPFERDQMAQMCQAILSGEPPSLTSLCPEAPPGLESVILGCLEKDPANRIDVAALAHGIAPFGPSGADGLAQRIASLASRGARTDSDAPGSGTVPRGSVPGGPRSAPQSPPVAAQSAPGSSVPPVASQPGGPSSGQSLGRVVPPHSWAQILRDRPRRAKGGGGNMVGAGFVLLLLLVVAGLVWTNRHALDPAPPAAPSSSAATSATGATTATPVSPAARPLGTAVSKPPAR
jgi:serine/threonine-protein kinase